MDPIGITIHALSSISNLRNIIDNLEEATDVMQDVTTQLEALQRPLSALRNLQAPERTAYVGMKEDLERIGVAEAVNYCALSCARLSKKLEQWTKHSGTTKLSIKDRLSVGLWNKEKIQTFRTELYCCHSIVEFSIYNADLKSLVQSNIATRQQKSIKLRHHDLAIQQHMKLTKKKQEEAWQRRKDLVTHGDEIEDEDGGAQRILAIQETKEQSYLLEADELAFEVISQLLSEISVPQGGRGANSAYSTDSSLDGEQLDKLRRMSHRASTFWNRGQLDEAEKLDVKVMEISKTTLGVDHPDTLRSMENLSLTFRSQGRFKEAEKLNSEVMEKSKSKLGVDHPLTLARMSLLTSIYRKQGQLEEAVQLGIQVMEISKMKFGVDHPNTLLSIASLASTYRLQGRLEEAEQLGVQVMKTSKTKLGVDNPDTLMSMASLASTYRRQGRWEEAEQLDIQVMEVSKEKLGMDHPDTLMHMANLASIFCDQGRLREAELLDIQVMEMSKKKLGIGHLDTLMSMANLASTYRRQGRREEAEQLDIQVMETSKNFLGVSTSRTLLSTHFSRRLLEPLDKSRASENLPITPYIPQTFLARKLQEVYTWLSRFVTLKSNYEEPGRSQMFSTGIAHQGTQDLVSCVEAMRSFGLDASVRGRLIYAADHGIRGRPLSPGWHAEIRRDVFCRKDTAQWHSTPCWFRFLAIYSPPAVGYQRIPYICGCGEFTYIDVRELSTGGIDRFRRSLFARSRAVQNQAQTGSVPTGPESPPQAHLSHETVGRNSSETLYFPSVPGQPTSTQHENTPSYITSLNYQSSKFLLLCVNTKQLAVLSHVDVSSLINDQYLFEQILREYHNGRGNPGFNVLSKVPQWLCKSLDVLLTRIPDLQCLSRFLSLFPFLRQICQMRLYKIESGDYVQFQLVPVGMQCFPMWFQTKRIPPKAEVDAGRYIYDPVPMDDVELAYIPLKHLLKPGPHTDNFWLTRFPKKVQDPLFRLPGSYGLPVIGWGIRVNESLNWSAVLLSIIIILLMIGLSVIIYALATSDNSSAFGLGALLVGLMAVYLPYQVYAWKENV